MWIVRYLIVCGFIFLFNACKKEENQPCNDQIGLFKISKYPIGTAIESNELNGDSTYRNLALKQFNSITPENIFKAEYLHPEENFYNWIEADSLVSFCIKNQKRIHGHTLIWHQQLPDWIKNYQGSSEDWEQLMKSHIQTIIKHYKGKIESWDVVNEAINEDGSLRNSIWKEKIGPSYIEKAFLFAREADPDVLLFYNDFNLESNPKKLNAAINLLNQLRSRGIKVDGIGVQMHINILNPDPQQISNTFKTIANQNYLVHVSELDISINPLNKIIEPNHELLNEQANLLASLIIHYNQIPKKLRYGITFWGISDKNSWIRSFYKRVDYPLLFDDNYLPKPCYCKLLKNL